MTYSLSITGVPAGNVYQPAKELTITDANCVTPGAEQYAMQTGTQFLVQQPDGSQAYYTYDAERCIPGVQRVLRRV